MSKRVWAIAALVFLIGESPLAAALSSDQYKCQKQVGSAGGAFLKKVLGTLQKCENGISSGKLPLATDCLLETETAAKIAAYEQSLTDKVTGSCSDALVASLTFGGQCNGMATVTDLVTCLIQTHKDMVVELADTAYGDTELLDSESAKCEKTAAKSALSFLAKQHSLLRKCKNNVNKGKLPPDTVCTTQVASDLAKAHAKLAAKTKGLCTDFDVSQMSFANACAGVNKSAGLATCALRSHGEGDEEMILLEYGSPAAGGAAEAKLISNAADCVGGPLSRCRVGDYLLHNDQIRVVIQDVQRNLYGIGQFGGQIIDADLVRTIPDPDRDNFEEWSTSVNIEGTAHYTSISVLNDGSNGEDAIIRVTGVDDLLDFLNPSTTVAGLGFELFASADDTDLPVQIQTDYILKPGRNYVRVETTIFNIGGSDIDIFFGDFLNGSGQLKQFMPAYGFGEPLATLSCATASSLCNTIIYSGFGNAAGVSYGYMTDDRQSSAFTTSGVSVPLIGSEVLLALTGQTGPPHAIAASGAPGDSKTFTRHFIVGDGTVSSILDTRHQIDFLPTGTLQGTATAGGNPVANAQIAVLGATSNGPSLAMLSSNVVTHTYTDASGNYSLTVQPGTYTVVGNVEGYPFESGGSTPTSHAVVIEANATTTQDLAFPATGQLVVNVIDDDDDPIAAKISIVGIEASPDPRNTQNILGIIRNTTGIFNDLFNDGVPTGVVQAHFAGPGGSIGPVAVEPGSYRVVVSHGIEFSAYSEDITVTAGATTTVNAQIARVTDSSNLVSGDFHVHSIDSPDSSIPRADRVVSMLAEGVDFFTPSDHEFRADFEPTVTALGATSLIKTATSAEITTFDYGHFNAWPVPIDPSKVNGGAVDHGRAAPAGEDFPSFGNYSLTPAEIVAAARADGAGTVQINHVHSFFGLGGGSGLAIDTGLTPPQSAVSGAGRRLDPMVSNYFPDAVNRPDAFELWIGDDRSQIYNNFLGRNIGDWFNMINQGIVKTGLANSDTHRRIITQAGIPRNLISSSIDDPASIVPTTVSANLNDGRVVGTNGPIVRVTTSASSTGDSGGLGIGEAKTIATTDGEVEIEVEVQSPIWAPFDRIEFYVNPATTKTTSQEDSGAGLVTVTQYGVSPSYTHVDGVDFVRTIDVVDGSIPGASRYEASTTLNLSGLMQDIWIVVLVRGTDGTSAPLFPVIPNDIVSKACSNDPCRSCTTDANCSGGGTCTVSNSTLAELTDGNLGQCGVTAMAFTNPVFVDVDGGGWTPPGVQINP